MADLCAEVEAACSVAPLARGDLVYEVYRRVHCRIAGDPGWSSNHRLADTVAHARRALADSPARLTGWIGRRASPEGIVLRDLAGIDVLVPAGVTVRDSPIGPVIATPAIAVTGQGRWLAWASSAPLAGGVRLYLNAHPDAAMSTWLSLVRALARSGLPARAKVASSAGLCARADCVVAYVARADLGALLRIVRAEIDEHSLEDASAGLACPVGRGVAIGVAAGSDGDALDVSVGQLWSERLVDAYLAGPGALDDACDELAAVWRGVRTELAVAR